MPGFAEVVMAAWNKPLQQTDAIRKLHIKLSRTAKALKQWQKATIGNIKLQIAVAKETIWRFDVAEETRQLIPDEIEFRKRIKLKYQGLLVIEKIRAQQRSRLNNIKAADANTKLFYIRANGRKRKKHIQAIKTEGGFIVAHKDKERVVHQHFTKQLGTRNQRSLTLNWNEIEMEHFDLDDLEQDITEEEVRKVIFEMPCDKAPGPDGYTGFFFKHCWNVIKTDLIHVFHQLSQLRGSLFNLLNSANMVLIPKKEKSMCVGDYRPISLNHSIAKIFSKILAN